MRQQAGLRMVGEVADGWAALEAIRALRPTVAVLAADLGGIGGFRILNAVVRDDLPTRVLLVGSPGPLTGYDAIAAGAWGWLSRASRTDELCETILAAGRGQVALPGAERAAIARRIRERSPSAPDVLSERERELLRLLADGRTPAEAARTLHLSAGTVKTTLLRLYRRVGVADRTALVAVGLRRGWID